MKKRITNEEFNVDEIQQVAEFVPFKAEEYKVNEAYNNKSEEYQVEEIQEDTSEEKKNKKTSKREDLSDQLKNPSFTSTLTGIGATGGLVAIAAIGGGIILDEAYLTKTYYQVNYEMQNDKLTSSVTVNFENNLPENYSFVLANEDVEVEVSFDSFTVSNLTLDNHQFLLNIYNEKEEKVDEITFDVNTSHPYKYIEEVGMDYLYTYNMNSYNIYTLPISDELPNAFETCIYTADNEELSSVSSKGITYIEDLSYEEKDFIVRSYFVDDSKNKYEICSYQINDDPLAINYEVVINDLDMEVKIYDELAENLTLEVKYLDNSSVELFNIEKSSYTPGETIKFSLPRRSEDIDITLNGKTISSKQNLSNKIKFAKGVLEKDANYTIKPQANFTNYGSIDVINYQLGYSEDKSNIESLMFYLDNQVLNGYKVLLKDLQTSSTIDISGKENFEIIDVAINEKLNYQLIVTTDLDKVVDVKEIVVNGKLPITISHQVGVDYVSTYNDDNSFNLYVYPIFENVLDDPFETKIYAYNSSNKLLDISSISLDGMGYIEDVNIDVSYFYVESYLLDENNNKYRLYYPVKLDINPQKINYDISAKDDQLSIRIEHEMYSAISMIINYVDGSSQEEIINITDFESVDYLNFTLENSVSIENVQLSGRLTLYDVNDHGRVSPLKGSVDKLFVETCEVNHDFSTEVTVLGIEYLGLDSYDQLPKVNVVLDGYLNQGHTGKLTVLDSANSEIKVLENISSLDKVEVSGLTQTESLTFKVDIYDSSSNVICTDSYVANASFPSQYENLNYTFNYQNPGDVYLRYHDDGTYTAYVNTEFENNSGYEMFQRIELTDGPVVDSIDPIVVIDGLEKTSFYGITYSLFVKEGTNAYIVNDPIVPSGGLEHYLNEDGYLAEYSASISETTTDSKIFNISFPYPVKGDVKINAILDPEETTQQVLETIVILEENITNSNSSWLVEFDLSTYSFTSANFTVYASINKGYYNESVIINALGDSLEGTPYIDCYVELSY